ncbi:hypothetical protein FKV24_005670 [Lysobacter maris]|uniref:Uncharacterized protein n=1 Tax=Marilutibacter maris TaxID=1605891 RepID=A0A508B6T5_9GAMM|nr:hypothetical protein [Lysobacter maris]KAB8194976.1 hypothetical protein FKV24_005670 [Lysobacter maris]
MDHFLIWNTVSMAWTEIGLDDDEYPAIARELRRNANVLYRGEPGNVAGRKKPARFSSRHLS